jgi:hypothetical protein
VRSSVKIFPSISSLPLRERIKVRGAVKIFSSFFPLHSAGEGKGEGVFFFILFSPLAGENKSEGCR